MPGRPENGEDAQSGMPTVDTTPISVISSDDFLAVVKEVAPPLDHTFQVVRVVESIIKRFGKIIHMSPYDYSGLRGLLAREYGDQRMIALFDELRRAEVRFSTNLE